MTRGGEYPRGAAEHTAAAKRCWPCHVPSSMIPLHTALLALLHPEPMIEPMSYDTNLPPSTGLAEQL
jgi:hypothetical protein